MTRCTAALPCSRWKRRIVWARGARVGGPQGRDRPVRRLLLGGALLLVVGGRLLLARVALLLGEGIRPARAADGPQPATWASPAGPRMSSW